MSPKKELTKLYPDAACWPVEKFGQDLLISGAYCIVLNATPTLRICPAGGDSPRAAWNNAFFYMNDVDRPDAPTVEPTDTAPQPLPEEKRIYVLLPQTVQIREHFQGKELSPRSIPMEAGRLIAQGEHVVSLMRMKHVDDLGMGPITTINLSVRNSLELEKVAVELSQMSGVKLTVFHDMNLDFYDSEDDVLTAICTTPITKAEAKDALGHLELFKARGE